jgi:hypothetical protein
MKMSNDRLKYLQSYFENQKVKVTVPPVESMTSKGKVVYYFEGKRCGYDFKRGVAFVDKKDIHKFKESYPHMIIEANDEREGV